MFMLLLAFAAFATSILSGVFGMAGGLILMGVYASLLPVATAMVLHGTTQIAANGMRAVLLFREVYAPGLRAYTVGALLAFIALSQLRVVLPPFGVFLGLGLLPFAARLMPADKLDFANPRAAMLCGALVAGVQLLAGVAGPLLDVFFLQTRLTTRQIVATKAVTQVFSHGLKLVYFGTLLKAGQLDAELGLYVVIAALLGTTVGTRILEKISDHSFRRWTRVIVLWTGGFYLCKALVLIVP